MLARFDVDSKVCIKCSRGQKLLPTLTGGIWVVVDSDVGVESLPTVMLVCELLPTVTVGDKKWVIRSVGPI